MIAKRTQTDKIRRAANHPDRPGLSCKAPEGQFVPVINRGRCEGKSDCVAVCPYDVFEVRTIAPDDFNALSMLARLRVRVHGMKSAYTPNADACLACGLCVVACPEQAIHLVELNRKDSGLNAPDGNQTFAEE